jgi:hypothetical protein
LALCSVNTGAFKAYDLGSEWRLGGFAVHPRRQRLLALAGLSAGDFLFVTLLAAASRMLI